MAATFEQLLAQLKKGTFESVLRSFVPETEQKLLQFCAATRSFDEKIFNDVFLPSLSEASRNEITFQALCNSRAVEPVAGVQGCFQLRESAKKEYFEFWQNADSPTLETFSKQLVSYYESLGPAFELDVLYQQIVAGGPKARKQFMSLYQEADSKFDLGRCQDILRILEARYSLLDDRLQTLYKDKQHLLKARGLWSREHYQTVNYYEIQELERRFEALWNDPSKWILQLHARGGTGKTMFLRWLIARRCVPEPWKIPCARVDFDFVDPVFATQNPSILLLEIGRQLNEQIPGNLFGEALGDMKEFKPILIKWDSVVPEQQQLVADAKRRASNEEIPYRFTNALQAARQQHQKRALLVMDTLEEVILYEGARMMPLLREIANLRGEDSNICLILSGRYDLREKLPDFEDEFGEQTETLQLSPFSDTDSRRYLVEKRGGTRLLDPVIKRANGNPFKLALYADVLRSNPHITANAIETISPGVLYLVDKILARIKNKRVRWLLRYGVVPRKLRLSFVREVMAQYLPSAMSGKAKYDNPKKDLSGEFKNKNPFEKVIRSAKTKIDFEELWQQLTVYASWNSWVTPDDEENTLSFHPEVLHPMRRLLRKHTIFRQLHRTAIKYYENKAKEFPNNAGQWLKEAVYHKFQLEGVNAGPYWRKQLNSPLITQNPESIQLLARDVINLAVQTDEEDASENGERLVDDVLRCEAYFEVAHANVRLARSNQVDPHDSLWQEAAKDFRYATKLQKDLKKKVIPPGRLAFVQAAILINQKSFGKAHQVLRDALRRNPKAQDRVELEIEFAASFSRQGNRQQAARHYHAALRLGSRARLKSAQLIDITKRLVGHYEALGEFTRAIKECKVALASAQKTNNGLAFLELCRRIAENYFVIGQFESALEYVRPRFLSTRHFLGQDVLKLQFEQLRLDLLRGRLERERLLPLRALKIFDEVSRSLDSLRGVKNSEPDLSYYSGRVHEEIALVYDELSDTSKALDELEEAIQLFKKANDDTSINRCMLHKIGIHLNSAHNVKGAKKLLDHVDRLTSGSPTPLSIPQELLRIRVLNHTGRQQTAQRRRRRLASIAKRQNWSANLRAQIALAGVINRAGTTSSVSLRETVTTLKRVSPASHRLALLKDLRPCPPPKNVAGRLPNILCDLLPTPNFNQRDGALNGLTLADALRVVGKKLAPKNLLERANKTFVQRNNVYALMEVYRAWDRLGWPGNTLSDQSRISGFLAEYENFPHAGVVVCLEHAQRLLNRDEFAEAERIITEVRNEIESISGVSPYWIGVSDELSGRLTIERFWSTHSNGTPLERRDEKLLKLGIAQLTRARIAFKRLQNRFAVKRLDTYIAAEKRRLVAANRKLVRPATARPRKFEVKTPSELADFGSDSIPTDKIDLYSVRSEQFAQATLAAKGYTVRLAKLSGGISVASERFPPLRVPQNDIRSLATIFFTPRGEVLSATFTKLLEQAWLVVTHEMVSVLRTDPSIQKRSLPAAGKPSTVGLEIDDIQLSSIPWEFVLTANFPDSKLPNFSINSIYRTLTDESRLFNAISSLQLGLQKLYPDQKIQADGFYGPRTVLNVEMFQRDHKLPITGVADYETIKLLHVLLSSTFPARVLIVQPSTQRQLSSERGHGSSGLDLRWGYSSRCFDVYFLKQPPLGSLSAALADTKPQILHLCGSMARSTSSGINLDFGTVQFSLSGFSKILEQASSEHKIRPLLILDLPRPTVVGEAVTQLLLRNAFAASLMRMVNPPAILATGLFQAQLQYAFMKILITSLRDGLPFGEIADAIRNTTPNKLLNWPVKLNLGYLIGPFGTALFTQDPSALLL